MILFGITKDDEIRICKTDTLKAGFEKLGDTRIIFYGTLHEDTVKKVVDNELIGYIKIYKRI